MGPGFYRAASFTLIGGAAASVLAALTGFWDWLRSTEAGTQARRRTANAHAWTMVTVTVIVLAGIAVRVLAFWDEPSTTGFALAFTVAAAGLTALGGTIGGSLVFDYGFNVETAGDNYLHLATGAIAVCGSAPSAPAGAPEARPANPPQPRRTRRAADDPSNLPTDIDRLLALLAASH